MDGDRDQCPGNREKSWLLIKGRAKPVVPRAFLFDLATHQLSLGSMTCPLSFKLKLSKRPFRKEAKLRDF